MTTANDFGQAILEKLNKTKADIKADGAEFSELFLVLDDAGDFALEFDCLGQTFNLNKQGLFTFNELGLAFELKSDFEEDVTAFLAWRLSIIENRAI